MNIIVFVMDQLSALALDLYGGPFHAPAISSLAGNGVLVEDAYCNYPLCQPSRASLWTGQYPHRNRVWSNGRKWPITPIDSSFPALGEAFASAGWECRHFGKKHDGGALRGFICSAEEERKIGNGNDAFPYNMDTYADAYTVDETLSYIKKRRDERPLLMVVDLINPHNICGWIGVNKGPHEDVPFDGELPQLPVNFHFDDIASRPLPVQYICCSHVRQGQVSAWTEENYRHYLAAYNYYLQRADSDMKRVLDEAASAGLIDDETLIVFTSDHGDNLTSRGAVTKQVSLYEEVTRVPLIFSGPAVKARGSAEGLASLLDLFPTLLGVAGLEPDERLDGMDISGILAGSAMPEHGYVASEWFTEWGYTISPGRMIRIGHYKYMHYLEGDGEELYDLEKDPREMKNLAKDPSYSAVIEEMRTALERHIDRSADPYHSLEVKVDKRWRSHPVGYHRHEGPTAPEV